MDARVFEAMRPYMMERFYNPSATYMPALDVRKDIEAARARLSVILGSRPSEIIFTAGGTEANNLVIKGVMGQYPDSNLVVSAIEHESVLEPARTFLYKEAPVSAKGIVDIEKLTALIDNKTVLVSVMYANNEVGSIQPVHQIALAMQEIRRQRQKDGNKCPLYLHTDAAQAAAYLDLHAARLGVDFMTINGGKLYGPKQTGLVFAASHTRFTPQILGGGQERGLRSGTENVAGMIGLVTALELVQKRRHKETGRLQELQHLFFNLLEEEIPSVIFNGSRQNRLPNNVHLTIPGTDNERILIALDDAGILCAAGSACSASNEEPSHVLRAMGLSDAEAQASLRFSMGLSTDEAAVRQAATALHTALSA